jgi:hypothetical protein
MDAMQFAAGKPEKTPELVALNVIRVETALSRYPVHRLAKQGTIGIEIREKSEAGDVVIQWKVSHNSEYGQPGPLAYKLDTLIVNRRIEEAARPIPKLIKLGSQAAIATELGISTHDTVSTIKRALYQNASAFITAKVRYRPVDGSETTLEAGFTRYAVVFTGEKLSDGRPADAVYLELSDRFMQVINSAQTRPLDYDYLKDLLPASQRLYELLSFQMYAALKHNRSRARLAYSEFCTHAPLTRHHEWLRVRTQMNKLHAPHKKSGYIAGVELEQSIDVAGHPDWLMLYVPGPKARAEFRAFNKKGGSKILEIEQAPPALTAPARPESTPIERELISRGVTTSTAGELVADYPEADIRARIEVFDWLVAKKDRRVSKSPAGWLADSIRKEYDAPKGFETKADRETRLEAEETKRRKELDDARQKRAEQLREAELERRITERWEAMEPDEQASLEKRALAESDEETRQGYEKTMPDTFRQFLMTGIRRGHLRRLIEEETPLALTTPPGRPGAPESNDSWRAEGSKG